MGQCAVTSKSTQEFCNVLSTCNFDCKILPLVANLWNKYNMSCGVSQRQWTLLVISSWSNCATLASNVVMTTIAFFGCPCHFPNWKGSQISRPTFFFFVSFYFLCLLFVIFYVVFLFSRVLSLDISPRPLCGFLQKWYEDLDYHIWNMSKLGSSYQVLLGFTFGYKHHSCFQLLLPLPLSLKPLMFQICHSAPPTSWVNQHSNHSMEFTNNFSPPAHMVKNWSFSTMHFTLELLRKALGYL